MNIKSYLWIFPFFSFLLGYVFLHYTFQVKYVETPLVVGRTIDQAVPLLAELNLNIRLLHYKEDADVHPGTILSQIPQARQHIKPHQSVFLVVSKQPPLCCAPDVRNQTTDSIQDKLSANGIAVQIYHVPSQYLPNHCIAQAPFPGEPLYTNNMTVYVANADDQKMIWPHFMGKRVEDIKEFLQPYGIITDIIHTYQPQAGHVCTNCLVVDQRPLPGSIIILNAPKNPLRVQLQVE
ncbi:MAG: PASTA domain-containing protein [Candidatus Dependentiae bacterium]|nr:PASTA domain-containing protein [Candidatus Dependentiae bacterium]